MMEQVKPPRSAFVNFPLGRPFGKPNDRDLQGRILKDVLHILVTAETPGEIVDLPYEWDKAFDWACYMQDVQDMLAEENINAQEWASKE
jgi:hypothetical protein